MRRIIVAVLILVLLLGVVPVGIGKLAESRLNAGLDRFIERAPYLSIVERKWTPGWFRSEQEVTLEVLGPWMRALNPATVMDEIKKAQPAQAHVAGAGTPDAVADGAAPPAGNGPVAAAAEPVKPLRFTLRNEILHGPVLWPTSFGIARVNTRLVMTEQIRKELMELFGTDEPVRVSSRVGFFGGGTTTFSGDAHVMKITNQPGALSWDAFKLDISYSRNLDDVDADGEWPRFEFHNSASGESLLLRDMTLTSSSERIHGDLYDTDCRLAIAELRMVSADHSETDLANVYYTADTNLDDDFLDVTTRLGSGAVKNRALSDIDVQVREIHYDFTLRRLHAATLEKMMAAFKASYRQPVADAAAVDAAVTAPMKEYGLALLKHDPELVIDRIGIVTPEGEGFMKGLIRLRGVNDQDLAIGAMALLKKVEADIAIDLPQKMIEKFPSGAATAATAINGGYASWKGDRLLSRIEFKHGELKINGKAQGIPGVGGPPPPPPTPE